MKKINPDNKIFSSAEFQKDKYKFSLILQNLDSKDLELYSDEENYVLCRGGLKWPTWIWTKDNFDVSLLKEIEETIKLYLLDTETRFTCKKELYNYLVDDKFEYLGDYYFEMGYLTCSNTIKPKETDGHIDVVTKEDKKTLVEFIYNESKEITDVQEVSIEEANEVFDKLLERGTYYVWKKQNEEIVSQASYRIVNGNAKVASVYTKPEERGKAYAANLIYTMTNELLEKGYHVALYTDYGYIPSNKAYKNVGYVDEDVLINFSCSKEKNNRIKR